MEIVIRRGFLIGGASLLTIMLLSVAFASDASGFSSQIEDSGAIVFTDQFDGDSFAMCSDGGEVVRRGSVLLPDGESGETLGSFHRSPVDAAAAHLADFARSASIENESFAESDMDPRVVERYLEYFAEYHAPARKLPELELAYVEDKGFASRMELESTGELDGNVDVVERWIVSFPNENASAADSSKWVDVRLSVVGSSDQGYIVASSHVCRSLIVSDGATDARAAMIQNLQIELGQEK